MESAGPLVFALPDLVASTLLHEKPPTVLRAWRVVPVGRQGSLGPVKFRGEALIDPVHEDPFRRWIELRQLIKAGAPPYNALSDT